MRCFNYLKRISHQHVTERLARRLASAAVIAVLILAGAQEGSRVSASRARVAPQQAAPAPLKLKQAIEGKLSGGQVRNYTMTVAAQQFIRVTVEQRGIDVVVRLLDAQGKPLAEVDRPNGKDGPEELLWVTQAAGAFTVEVKALEEKAEAGSYAVQWTESRAASAEDAVRVSAQAAVAAGNALRAKNEETSHREAAAQFAEAARLWTQVGEREHAAYAQLILGWTWAALAEFPRAEAAYRAAQQLWRDNAAGQALVQESFASLKEQAAAQAGQAAYDRGGAFFAQGTAEGYRQALEQYLKAAELFQQAGNQAKTALAFHDAGFVASKLGEQQKALEYYAQALPLRRAVGHRGGEARTLTNIGDVYAALGEQQKALEYYAQALPLCRAVGHRDGEATTLNNIGLVYSALGERQKALEYYVQALPLRRAVGDRGGEAATLNNIGSVYNALGEQQKALEYYAQALPLYRAVGHRGGEATTLNNIGSVYYALGERQKALEYYVQALPLLRAVGDRDGEAATLNNIGGVYSALGEQQKALEYYAQALPLRRAVGHRGGEARMLNNIGLVYSALGEQQKALEYYAQALPLLRAVGDRDGEAATLNNIGLVYSALGERQKALEYYAQALPLRGAMGDRDGEATTLTNLGSVYAALGEQQKALEYYAQALPLRRAVGDRDGEATTLHNIGLVYSALGERQKALEYYAQALPLRRAVGDRGGEAATLTNLGSVYYALGEQQKALEYYVQALPLLRAVGDRDGEATTLHNFGSVYSALGEQQKALEYYVQALPLRRAVGDRGGEAATLHHLMYLWEKTNPSVAVIFGKQSVNRYQELRAAISGLDKTIQQTYRQSVEGAYRKLSDILIKQGRIAEAEAVRGLLEEQEYYKYIRRDPTTAAALSRRLDLTAAEAKALTEYARLGDQLTAIGTELIQLEERKQKLPPSTAFPQQARLDELKEQLATGARSMQVFFRQLGETFGKRDERVTEIASSGLKSDLRNWGVKETVVIAAYTDKDALTLVVTTPVTQEAHRTEIKAEDLNQMIADFRAAVTDPCACRDPREAGLKLYDLLVKPLEADLKGAQAKTLLWLMDGALTYVPVAALWDGRQYLAERFDQAMLSFNTRGKLGVAPKPVSQWRVLGAGVSQSWRNFSALPAVPAELNGIVRETAAARGQAAGVLPGSKLLDAAFTKKNWEDAIARRFPVLHIASHFSFSPGKENGSYLLLGDGTAYTLEEVATSEPIFTGVELLALSACNTAMGDSNGIEVKGFARLAQEQGALAVLATLWAVADESTAKLMREFYRLRLAETQITKATALRRAQLALLSGEIKAGVVGERRSSLAGETKSGKFKPFPTDASKPYAHPYFWAPFILIGNWR